MTDSKPLLTMADVLLACGELSKEERVAVRYAIDFYERLITEGKLRVAVEVELMYKDEHPTEWWCSGCDWRGAPSHYSYCPGCGNPIKR